MIFSLNYSFRRKEDQEWWLSKSDNSKVGLRSSMKNTDINGLHKIWSKQAEDNRNIYFLKITNINLKRMMLSSHKQASVSFCVRGHSEDTSSTSLKYYMQDITVNNYHFISLKIIMLVFIT